MYKRYFREVWITFEWNVSKKVELILAGIYAGLISRKMVGGDLKNKNDAFLKLNLEKLLHISKFIIRVVLKKKKKKES